MTSARECGTQARMIVRIVKEVAPFFMIMVVVCVSILAKTTQAV